MERGRGTLRHGGRSGEPRAATRHGRRFGRRARHGYGQVGGAARSLGGAGGVGVGDVTAVAGPVALRFVRGPGSARGGAVRTMGGATVHVRVVRALLRLARTGARRMGRCEVVRAPAVPAARNAAALDTAVPAAALDTAVLTRVHTGGCVPGARCRSRPGWGRRTEAVHGEQTAEDDGDQHGRRAAAAHRCAHACARPRRH